MSEAILEVRDLHVSIADKPELTIVKGANLEIRPGEIHALMGPNGSGKSTLANTIAGSPAYEVDSGQVLFHGQDVTEMAPDERARLGMFLSFQYPTAIPGVTMVNFLREALKARAVYQGPIVAPFEAGEEVGVLKLWQGDRLIREAPLYTAEAVAAGRLHQNALDAVGELLFGWL